MNANDGRRRSRREFLEMAGAVAASVALAGLPLTARAASSASGPGMKIGIIGSGRIGGTLGGLWVKAGHEVLFSARNLDPVQKLVAGLGPMAHAGTPKEAAVFGDVVLISVPYGALPQLGRDLAGDLKGKVVFLNFWLTTCGPCLAEMPGIEALHKSLNSEQVVFLAVTPEDEQQVRGFLKKIPLHVPVYLADGQPPDDLHGFGYPTTYILDRNGAAVFKNVGAFNWDDEGTRVFIRNLAAL